MRWLLDNGESASYSVPILHADMEAVSYAET